MAMQISEQPCREKNWEELDLVEKVDRMREVVKSLRKSIGVQERTIHKLRHHEHLNDKIYYELDSYGGGEEEQRSGRKTWF